MERAIQLLGVFLAGFVAWMLSGSPIPMGFSLLFPLLAWIAKLLQRPTSEGIVVTILFSFLGLLAMLAEIHLFRTGLAFAFRADLPFGFHFGMALVWVSTSLAILFSNPSSTESRYIAQIPALAGFLLIFSASLTTEYYDYEEWQVLPIAALPIAWTLAGLFLGKRNPALTFGSAIATALVLSGVALGVDQGILRVSEYFRNDDSQLSESAGLRRPAPLGQTGDAGGGARRLPRETDIQFDGQVRIVLQTKSPTLFATWRSEPVYLRTSTVSVFESDELIAPIRSGRWIYDGDDEVEDLAVTLSSSPESPVASYSVYTRKDAANAIPLLPQSSTLSVSAVYEYADSWYQLTPPEEAQGFRYEAITPISRPDLKPYSSSALVRPDAPGLYLNLPPSPLAGRIRALAEELSKTDAVREIRNRLQNETSYTLEYETPPDETPIGNLLFGEKEGHCEIYAAAAVLMLRASDIPSRVAYGYAGGMMDRERKMIAFRDQDSHAWAEILTPDNEWVIYDATPQDSAAAPRVPSLTSLADFESDGYLNLSEGAGTLERGRRPYRDRITDLVILFSDYFLEISFLAFLLVGLILTWQRRRGGKDTESPSEGPAHRISPRLNDMLQLLEKCGNQLGITKKEGMTWQEWLNLCPETPSCFENAVDYYYQTRYVEAPASPEKEKSIRRALAEWNDTALRD